MQILSSIFQTHNFTFNVLSSYFVVFLPPLIRWLFIALLLNEVIAVKCITRRCCSRTGELLSDSCRNVLWPQVHQVVQFNQNKMSQLRIWEMLIHHFFNVCTFVNRLQFAQKLFCVHTLLNFISKNTFQNSFYVLSHIVKKIAKTVACLFAPK